MKNKKMFEIVILGRGGQGAKSLGEIIAQGAGLEDKYTQAFPEFGPERSGAPVKAFVRISLEKIRTKETITNPDCILVLDEKLLAEKNSLINLKNNKTWIVNSKLSSQELRKKWKINQPVVSVNASGLAEEFLGKNFPNLGILGKFIFTTEQISLESGLSAYEKVYTSKIDPQKIFAGKKIIQKAYHLI